MNWIPFSKRRPESRKEDYTILVWSEDRPPFLTTVYSDGLVRYDAVKLTHWCEIEEPDLAKEALKELVAKVIVDMARKDAIEQAKAEK